MPIPDRGQFVEGVRVMREGHPRETLVVPVAVRLLEDQLTPVLAYRRLVAPDERTAPSFLFESVEGGERQGRHSILGAQPAIEIVARGHEVNIVNHRDGTTSRSVEADPLEVPRRLSKSRRLVHLPLHPAIGEEMPRCLLGGWVGYAAYDTARYAEPEKLDPKNAPRDDRGLPELQFAYYDGVVVFDHVQKLVYVVRLAEVPPTASDEEAGRIFDSAVGAIDARVRELQTHSKPLPLGRMPSRGGAPAGLKSNITREQHAAMLSRALEYIRAGDIFQVVLGQRFEKRSTADPFDVYRALRTVNPSPYMVYLQGQGVILIASSPEILCRVRRLPIAAGVSASTPRYLLTNRPLAGTRRRGLTPAEDQALERELLADPKERAEHIMLVDLGRNDVGKVCKPGTIDLPVVMGIEKYSHVMHISSTVTGELREGLDCWDALRATLPVGTISGAPKIRAMQIIDELEPVRRGPYGGGIGYVSLDGDMDIALALRTIVVPTAQREGDTWMYHLQAAGGIVSDSDADAEYKETVVKSAALARAIEVAERAFGDATVRR